MPVYALTHEGTTIMEITEQEKEMIMKKRAEDTRNAQREAFIDEMNDLINRIQQAGFGVTMSGSHFISHAENWGDTAGKYIKLN